MAKPIPCLVGFGGLTPAGRGSHNLSYSRMIYDLESEQNKFNYLKSVLTLCGLIDETTEAPEIEQLILSKENEVLEHEYDGIQEFDNDLPPWLLYLVYFTVCWGVV